MKQITSSQNPYIKSLVQLQDKAKMRKQTGTFIIEGKREIELALKGGYDLETILFVSLKGIAKNHLLVVVFFNNTELEDLIHKKADNIHEIYDKVIAEKFAFEKRLIVNELKKYGIYSVLTDPENLTLDTINKYLEIKARGIL